LFEEIQEVIRHVRLDKKLLDSISMADEAQVWGALAEGADIQADNNKPLIMAVGCGAANVVQLLLDQGAKLNVTDGEKQSAIWLAVNKGNFVLTKMLTEYGAYVNIHNGASTPLFEASHQGNNVLVKYLLQHGADKESQ
jgi:ankyrin repeat protein